MTDCCKGKFTEWTSDRLGIPTPYKVWALLIAIGISISDQCTQAWPEIIIIVSAKVLNLLTPFRDLVGLIVYCAL